MQTRNASGMIMSALGMLMLILDSKTALSGAEEGIRLIIYTVIPSLFPFFFLSIWLTGSAGASSFPPLRWIGKLFRLPAGTEYLLLPAFLGGYPAGAQAVTTAWEQGQLSKHTAHRLLSFCSNAGPSFIFGILSGMFPDKSFLWLLWLLHICGALLASHCYAVSDMADLKSVPAEPKSVSDILKAAIQVMASVSGWVLLFRILIGFLEKWVLWLFPTEVRILLTGLLELTNGCCSLNRISDTRLRFLLCSVMLSYGGLCVTMQTRSVIKTLDIGFYLKGKLIQTGFSILLGYGILYTPIAIIPLLGLAAFFALFRRKRSSNPIPSGV